MMQMKSRSIRRLLRYSLICILVALPLAARAQTADLSGELRDPDRARIPSATVTVTQDATGVKQATHTNREGAYFFSLQPGTYSMLIAAPGFKPVNRQNIVLQVAQPARLDFTLEVGNDTQTVTVNSGTELLQESPSVGKTITEDEIARLPINGANVNGTYGRNYTTLILLMPGASDVSVAGGDGTISGTALYSVNGQRNQDNNYTLDGIDNNFFHKQSPGLSPPMDALKEFRVATNNSSGFGRSAGANVALVTKSGASKLHGSVYEYSRQSVFDANSWFNNYVTPQIAKRPFHYNEFGVNAGGPVVLPKLYKGRKNTFWFFSYEGFSLRQSNPILSDVPTAAERAGDFSSLSQTIYDAQTTVATTTGGKTTLQRTKFAGNIVPTNRLDPVALAYLNMLVPLPNIAGAKTGGSNYMNETPLRNDRNVYVGRLDYHLNEKNSFFFRVLNQTAAQTKPQSLPDFSEITSFSGYNYGAGWDFIPGSRDLLQVRFGYNNPQGPDVTRNNLGVTRNQFFAQTGIQIFAAQAPYDVLPTISANDFSITETGGTSRDSVFEANAIYNRTIGTGLLKVGFTFQPRQYYHDATSPTSGTATYDVTKTDLDGSQITSGSGTASFLLGYPSKIDRGLGNADVDAAQKFYSLFAVYNRKFGKRLTVETGVRYEFYKPAVDKQNRLGTLWVHNDPVSGSVTGTLLWAGVNPLPDPVTGLVNDPANQGGFGNSLAVTNYFNFMPRVGLAYLVAKHTVVRSGFGIYDNSTAFQEVQDERKFYPYNLDQSIATNTGTVPDTSLLSTGPSYSSTAALAGYAQAPNKKTPYSYQYNLTVQSELPAHIEAQIAYVGSTSKHLIGYEPFNTAPVASPLYTLPATVNARRLLPEFGDVYQGANRYRANYNALQVDARKRYRSGLEFQGNYTYGRSLDNQSSLGEIKTQDPFNPGPDYSRSSFDLTHIFNLSFVYDLPFGRGRRFETRLPRALDAFIGGWSMQSINRFETGPPVSVTLGGLDEANTGYAGSTAQRPNVIGDPNAGARTVTQWFNTQAFLTDPPVAGTYGNSRPFTIHTDAIRKSDLSIYKRFITFEQQSFDLRLEAFNLPNTPSFAAPKVNEQAQGSFGTINGTSVAARQLQLAVRYTF